MSRIIEDNRNLLLNLKSNMGLYHFVLTTPKNSLEKLTLTVVEIQQMPDIEKAASKKNFWPKPDDTKCYEKCM